MRGARARRRKWRALVALGAAWRTAVLAPSAGADEPKLPQEPRMFQETAEHTAVVDAFDREDPFDVHLSLRLLHTIKRAAIRRESALAQPGLSDGGYVASTENVARFAQSRTTLELGANVGLYRDLALVFRLPIILSDTRELTDLAGSTANPERLQDATGDTLFRVPFRSPARSGIDWFSLGLDYAILNQQRSDAPLTWLVSAAVRVAVGPRLHPCDADAAVQCPALENATLIRDPGISRGMNALDLHTAASRRMGYVEPYAGFGLFVESPQSNGDYGKSVEQDGVLLRRPPTQLHATVGIEAIPFERPDTAQRIVVGASFRGTYHSAGRDFSELFDALGTSQARSLRQAHASRYRAGQQGSVPDETSEQVYFAGITDQQPFSAVTAALGVTWQAGAFVKFAAGTSLTYAQSHLVTAADPCNPAAEAMPATAGACVSGVPNPNHRGVIDLPGHRFSVDDTTILDLWLRGVLMF